jgi:hypothetical protein
MYGADCCACTVLIACRHSSGGWASPLRASCSPSGGVSQLRSCDAITCCLVQATRLHADGCALTGVLQWRQPAASNPAGILHKQVDTETLGVHHDGASGHHSWHVIHARQAHLSWRPDPFQRSTAGVYPAHAHLASSPAADASQACLHAPLTQVSQLQSSNQEMCSFAASCVCVRGAV